MTQVLDHSSCVLCGVTEHAVPVLTPLMSSRDCRISRVRQHAALHHLGAAWD